MAARSAGKTRGVNVLPSVRRALVAILLPTLLGASCISHQHTVGLGSTGTGASHDRQYYALFGFWQINEVDTQRMAPDLTSYEVDTRYGFVDLLLAPLLLPLTMTSRTVTVRT